VTSSPQLQGTAFTLKALFGLREASRFLYLENHTPKRQGNFGEKRSVLRGRGMMYAESRAYQPGDDVRHMDWRITARYQQPHVKLFEEERERPVLLAIDLSPSLYFGTRIAFKSVLAAEVAGLLTWAAVDVGDRIGAVIQSPSHVSVIKPQSRQVGAMHVLQAIVESHDQLASLVDTATNFTELLQRVLRVSKPGGLVVIISDFQQWNETCEQPLQQLARHRDVLSIAIADPLEMAMPNVGQAAFTNGHDLLTINTQSMKIREQFYEDFHRRQEALKSFHQRYGARWIPLTTEMDVLQVLTHGLQLVRR